MSKNEQVVTKKVIKYCGNNGSCLKERLKENERKERQRTSNWSAKPLPTLHVTNSGI